MKDIKTRYDSTEYIFIIMLNAKNVDIIVTKTTQILFVYEHINEKLRRDLSRSKDNFTITDLLKKLRYQKDI